MLIAGQEHQSTTEVKIILVYYFSEYFLIYIHTRGFFELCCELMLTRKVWCFKFLEHGTRMLPWDLKTPKLAVFSGASFVLFYLTHEPDQSYIYTRIIDWSKHLQATWQNRCRLKSELDSSTLGWRLRAVPVTPAWEGILCGFLL